jgi:hypothetical protein
MNCAACQQPLPAGAHFCPACGTAVPAGEPATAAATPPGDLTPEARAELEAQRKQAETWLDAFLRAGGAEDPAELTDEDGVRRFSAGTISCNAAILEDNGSLYLHVDAALMALPSDHELLVPLMRELLELNAQLRGSVRAGIHREQVLAGAIRPLSQLSEAQLGETVAAVISLSDRLDEQLLTHFGGTVRQRPGGKTAGS